MVEGAEIAGSREMSKAFFWVEYQVANADARQRPIEIPWRPDAEQIIARDFLALANERGPAAGIRDRAHP